MLILDRHDVYAALPISEAIVGMRWALEAFSTGQAVMPPRIMLPLPQAEAVCLVMPAFVPVDPDDTFGATLAVKAVSTIPQNASRGLPPIQGAVLVFDPTTGQCLALMDGAAITAIRTGAASGVATDLLARKDSSCLAILGAGVQAMTHAKAVCAVRNIETIWLWNRTFTRAETLAVELTRYPELPKDIRIVSTAREAVRNADILCTVTASKLPIFEDSDLRPGTHINAIGSFRADMQELPSLTVARSCLYCDNRAETLTKPGDILRPIEEGLMETSHLRGEIGELIAGSIAGRVSVGEVTLYKSVGMAAQDAVAASIALTRAQAFSIGQSVRWNEG